MTSYPSPMVTKDFSQTVIEIQPIENMHVLD